ncbi:MAG: thiamine diphosphokinase [Bacteroidales bacterium]|nr:thiamine diphosphokinase [Bacteroidales bacterium]
MEKTVVIICDGQFPKTEYPRYLMKTADFTICCDGALVKYLRASKSIFGEERTPDLVIGDMDTLSAAMQKKYAGIIVKEDEQEHNDQTKAVRWALSNIEGLSRIYIIGASGGRLDHTIGNASLLMEYTRLFDLDSKGITIESVTDNGSAFAINDTVEFDCGIGRQVSIFSPDNSLRIKSSGLEYRTDDVVFDNWWKATLNKAVSDTVRLEFNHPSMALVFLN